MLLVDAPHYTVLGPTLEIASQLMQTCAGNINAAVINVCVFVCVCMCVCVCVCVCVWVNLTN